MKEGAYYFPHDANARNDIKCIKLRRELGAEGYGMYWIVIETLREEPGQKLLLSNIEDIAYDNHLSKEKLEAVITRYDLFKIESNLFFSARLVRAVDEYNEKKIKYIEAGRLGGQASVKQRLSIGQAIKGNKRKGNNKTKVLLDESEKSFKTWSLEDFKKDISANKEILTAGAEDKSFLLNKFYNYWIEKSATGKMRFQLEKTWETKLRLVYWASNSLEKK